MSTRSPEKKIRNSLLRHDLSSFIQESFHATNPGVPYLHNWHIDYLARHLEAAGRGEITRLIINLPPRSLKSLCVSVAWPAWLLGRDPSRRIIAASYGQNLSLRHSLDTRLVMNSSWYRSVFPKTKFAKAQNEKHKFVTTKRGYRLATSVGGAVTGEGGNFLIVDDPHNPTHIFSESRRNAALQWFDQTFSSRLDDKKKGVFVIVMQRLHENDLTGHLLNKKGSEWVHIALPAISDSGDLLHSDRESVQELERAKIELGSYAFAAQYQQRPVPAGGGMLRPEWLKRYREAPQALRIIQSWDTAIKAGEGNDYSVCTSWAETAEGFYLLDVWRKRAEYPDLKRSIVNLAEKFQPHGIVMEDKASGQSLLQDLRRETKLPLIAINPTRDKLTRMAAVSPLFEAGKIWLPQHAAWLPDLEAELAAFPNGSHDDQCDSISQFLEWARRKRQESWRVRGL